MCMRGAGHLDLGQAMFHMTVDSICSKMLSRTSMAGLKARGPAGRVSLHCQRHVSSHGLPLYTQC